jgi:hypothetical protein
MTKTSPKELRYFFQATKYLSSRKYEEAFRVLIEGLEKNLETPNRVRTQDLISMFLMLLTSLIDSLEEQFGVDLQIGTENSDLEPFCSYCARKKSEVKVLMGGGGGAICDGCAKRFHEFAIQLISESTPGRTSRRSRKTADTKSTKARPQR